MVKKMATATQALFYWPVRLVLIFFTHYAVYGEENVLGIKAGPIIFAANHGSLVDGPISGVALPRGKGEWYPQKFFPIRWLVYEGFFKWRFLFIALYVRLNGCIKIKKEPKGNLPVILHEAVEVLKNGGKIWIYPEGKRSVDGRTQKKARRGVAYLQEETGAPIVPVGIWGNFGFFSKRTIFRRKKIRVRFGEPLYKLEGATLTEKAEFVVHKISELRR